MYEVTQHQSVELWQKLHHGHGSIRVLVVADTLFVELLGDDGLLQLPIPELEKRGWAERRCMRTALISSPPPSGANLAVRLSASGNGGQRRDSALVLFHLISVMALKCSGSQTGQTEGNTGSYLPAPPGSGSEAT